MSATPYFTPDFRVRPDDDTVLMAVDGTLSPGMVARPGGHGKFPVEEWRRPEQAITWDVTVDRAAAYAVNVLVWHEEAQPLTLSVRGGGQQVNGILSAETRRWVRLPLEGLLDLPAGPQTLILQAHGPSPDAAFHTQVIAIELVQPAVRDRQQAAARALRVETTWLRQARFGLMCHWTSRSQPRHGAPLPYAEAVQAFDVDRCADQVQAAGAGFLVLTTSHAEMYLPAPITALERLLPGRTAPRDLVADLAAALAARGIALMLYYHLGSCGDPAWLEASGFWKTDTREVFDHWAEIIGAIGRRYGTRLAGWWFDDGTISYYYRSAPWERLLRTARAGHPGRLVAFNPWVFPSPTEFQDYCCGECLDDPAADGMPIGADGHFTGGPYAGLQACATLITEGDWVHDRPDTEIGAPRWEAAQMAALLTAFIAHRNVPMFNLEIYQDGTFSPATIAMFRQASQSLRVPG